MELGGNPTVQRTPIDSHLGRSSLVGGVSSGPRRAPSRRPLARCHETYVGDVTRPVKRYLKQLGVDLDEYEARWQKLIWRRYDCVPVHKGQLQIINDADDLQMAREITSLAPEGPFRNYGRLLLNKYIGQRQGLEVRLMELDTCHANPRRDYMEFKKRFFELDGGKAQG